MGLTSKLGLQPLESPSLVAERKESLDIGILKSTSSEEKRVVLTPRNVEMLTADGYRVLVEIGAGKRAGFPDNLYAEASVSISINGLPTAPTVTITPQPATTSDNTL